MALILDAGPLLAALDSADPDHAACASLLTDAAEDLVVPVLVMAELDNWCARRLLPEAWTAFTEDVLAGAYRLEPPTISDLARCLALQDEYRDISLSLVDASLIALAERFGEPKIATLDHRRFRPVRPAHVEALEILP